ncbi:hypothetical protein [Flavobacterium frigoris]|jgi:hypothetical protein|uniref:SMODS and SLOG-associating 2TM effector domain-containing protein n=1 Tax=Flavobacterium frigoris (strain PS1) TaxID=1086011 RepID=H7FVM6_FLAFP|nr:hypothetical protein [Flavobacterium frigoris]EIA07448.1 hypothetical protein HJ01_03251 [Flavobacterium frigoris PS1]
MANKIWFEMVDKKYGEIYLTKYLSLQRTLKKYFTIMTLLVSVSGILSWKFFEDYAWIAFVLIAIMQLVILIENQIIRSDKEIEEISNLRMMYTKYFNKLEQLYTEFHYNRITKENAIDKYFELRKTDWEKIEELDCKLDIKKFNYLMNESENESNQYINQYHNYEQTK